VAARASQFLVARGKRSGAARGRSESFVAILGLPLRELQMLANHSWPNVEKLATYLVILQNKIPDM
jgi:hypothetical protein